VLAYFLASVIVLPAALSKAEMATAMPESGGTYLYVDRAMGPLMGTVAGLGTWFSLVFKSSFALVGLGAYLVLFVDLPPQMVALGLAVVLTAVNIVGVKQTGTLQAGLVTVVLLLIAGYAATGLINLQPDNLHPFFSKGAGGLFAATGFVFVSYAGVTKIASVAEEVEDPGRNIPAGILTSILVMMLIYTLVVLVTVGVATPEQLGVGGGAAKGSSTHLTPIAVAAEQFLGQWGMIVVSVTAVLALFSMANAGILSSSRYPLAMSRDELAPPTFRRVSERFGTPHAAIVLTGCLVLGLIAFVPVMELAKLASAFQICVFAGVNVALIAFREAELDWYEPEFESPAYPWLQLFGVVACVALLTQMGAVAWIGAAVIGVVSIVWFALYGREKVEREGAAVDALRRSGKETAIDTARERIESEVYKVLLPFSPGLDEAVERDLLRLGAAIAEQKNGRLLVAQFEEVPDQRTLSDAVEPTEADAAFERQIDDLVDELDIGITVEPLSVVTHENRRALVNLAEREHIDLMLADWAENFLERELPGNDLDWVMDHTPCDVLFLQNRGFDRVQRIAVVADEETYEPLQLQIAQYLAAATGGQIELYYGMERDPRSESKRDSAELYIGNIAELSEYDPKHEILEADEPIESVLEAIEGADVVITRESSHHILRDFVFGHFPDKLAESADCTVLLPYSPKTRTRTFLRYLWEKILY
ncbi:MAG: amino acid permease, partial [Bradymonadaceae bacterium]